MESKLILGTFSYRGMFQPIRYMLEYLEIPYEEKIYDFDDPKSWLNEKQTLGLDFPNLPYLIDGQVKITETRAILYYLISKSGRQDLCGKDLYDKCLIETISVITYEIAHFLYILHHIPKAIFLTKKNETLLKIMKRFGEFSNKLGEQDWILGYFSLADIYLMHSFEWVLEFDQRVFEIKKFKNLKELINRFYEIKQIKEFRAERDKFPHFLSQKMTLPQC